MDEQPAKTGLTDAQLAVHPTVYAADALGPVDTYRIHRIMAARVTTA